MVYKIDIQSNKSSSDGSILGKIKDFQKQLFIHEREEINILKKSPLTSASESKVLYFDRFDKKEKTALMFGSNNYLGAVVYFTPKVVLRQIWCKIALLKSHKRNRLIMLIYR